MRCQCPVDSWSGTPFFRQGSTYIHIIWHVISMASPQNMARFSMAIFHGETDQNNHWKSQHQAMAPNGKQTMSSVSGAQSFLCAVRELMKKREPTKGMKQRCYKWCILRIPPQFSGFQLISIVLVVTIILYMYGWIQRGKAFLSTGVHPSLSVGKYEHSAPRRLSHSHFTWKTYKILSRPNIYI